MSCIRTPDVALGQPAAVWRRISRRWRSVFRAGVPLSSAWHCSLNAHEEEYEPAPLADKLLVPRQTTTFILDSSKTSDWHDAPTR